MEIECITIDDSSDEVEILEEKISGPNRVAPKPAKHETGISWHTSKPLSINPQQTKKEMKLEVEITRIVKMDLERTMGSRIEVKDVCSLDPSKSPDVIVLNVSNPNVDEKDDDEVTFLGEFKASPTESKANLPSHKKVKQNPVPKKEIDLSSNSQVSLDDEESSTKRLDKSEENKEAFHQLCMLTLSGKEGCPDLRKAHAKLRKYFENAAVEVVESDQLNQVLKKAKEAVNEYSQGNKDILFTVNRIKDVLRCLSEGNALVNKKVKKLEKLLAKINRKIGKLEEMEVNSDDDASPYVHLDRYRKRAVDIHSKICSLVNCSADAERPTLKRLIMTDQDVPPPIQRALEKYYNRTKRFPDYPDVLRIVQYVVEKEDLKLKQGEDEIYAKRMFSEIGETLQRRRKYDDFIILSEYLNASDTEDPADKDPELHAKLMLNKANYIRKERELLDRFALKQEEKQKAKKCKEEGGQEEEEEDDDDDDGRRSSDDQESISEAALDNLMVDNNHQMSSSGGESEEEERLLSDSSSPPHKKQCT